VTLVIDWQLLLIVDGREKGLISFKFDLSLLKFINKGNAYRINTMVVCEDRMLRFMIILNLFLSSLILRNAVFQVAFGSFA
jgi:hypothetical protein